MEAGRESNDTRPHFDQLQKWTPSIKRAELNPQSRLCAPSRLERLSWEFTTAGLDTPTVKSPWWDPFDLLSTDFTGKGNQSNSLMLSRVGLSWCPHKKLTCALGPCSQNGPVQPHWQWSQIAHHFFRELLVPSRASHAASNLTYFQLCSQARWVRQSWGTIPALLSGLCERTVTPW